MRDRPYEYEYNLQVARLQDAIWGRSRVGQDIWGKRERRRGLRHEIEDDGDNELVSGRWNVNGEKREETIATEMAHLMSCPFLRA